MKALLATLLLLSGLASTAFCAPRKIPQEVPNAASLNINFDELWRYLQTTVTKASTQTITGDKTFTGDIVVSTLTLVSSATFTNLRVVSTLTGNVGTFSGALSGTTLNTGLGANELYAMNQNVQTSDAVTFAGLTVNGTIAVSNNTSSAFLVQGSASGANPRGRITNTNSTSGQDRRSLFIASGDNDNSGISLIGGKDSSNVDIGMVSGYNTLQLGVGGVAKALIEATSFNFHIQPPSGESDTSADVALEVSNGATTGGGTVHAASYANHSERRLKNSITYASAADRAKAYDDVKMLRPATFRYKVWDSTRGVLADDFTQPIHKGLIYDEVPVSLRGDHGDISLNDQIFLLQLALQEAMQKIEALEGKVK